MITPIQYEPLPTVSVILPVYNEAQFIERCLTAILEQDYPAEKVTILVIDGQSTDNTVALVKQLQQKHHAITLLDNPQRLQAYALNIGLAAANGEIVIRIDGHTIIDTDYIRQCVATLQAMAAQYVVNVGGRMLPVGETKWGWAIAAATRSPFSVPTAFHHSAQPQFVDTVYLGAWPRRVFELVGQFNPRVNINEDYEMNYRIRQRGGKIYLSPTIRSIYFCRPTLQALSQQYFRYGVQKVQMLSLHPTALRPRQLIPPLFVAALVGGPFAGLLWSGFWLLWVLLLSLYGTLGIAAAYRSRNIIKAEAGEQTPSLGLVWMAFITIHLAWGIGFWAGWLKVLRSARTKQI